MDGDDYLFTNIFKLLLCVNGWPASDLFRVGHELQHCKYYETRLKEEEMNFRTSKGFI